jgi:hypothetical protein
LRAAPIGAHNDAPLNRERFEAHNARIRQRSEVRQREIAAVKAALAQSAATSS